MTTEKLKRYFEFSLTNDNRTNGFCKLCNNDYKDMYGIYSNFVKHLKRKHLSEYQKAFSSIDDDLSEEMESFDPHHQSSKESTETSGKQTRVDFSMAKNLIIKCNLPLSLVENQAFREFIKECYPKWQPISARKLKSNMIVAFKNRIQTTICEMLEKVDTVTLTIDAWSDRRNRGFLGITCHLLDDRMLSQAFLIDFVRMKSPHTSDNIQRLTEYVLDRYNIKQKVYRIITDNASSMIKAYKFGLAADQNHSNYDAHNEETIIEDVSTLDDDDRK